MANDLTVIVVLLGSTQVKAARKALMKLIPDWSPDLPEKGRPSLPRTRHWQRRQPPRPRTSLRWSDEGGKSSCKTNSEIKVFS